MKSVNECRQPFAPSTGSQRSGSMKTSTTHFLRETFQGVLMSTAKQRTAAKRNVKKAVAAAKAKKTISHLSKSTRTALGKQGAKVAKERRAHA
jgi:hypothetical protein